MGIEPQPQCNVPPPLLLVLLLYSAVIPNVGGAPVSRCRLLFASCRNKAEALGQIRMDKKKFILPILK
jgi:hypothetical protein